MGALRAMTIAVFTSQVVQQATAACNNPTCTSPPCAANLVGDVGCTTAAGTETYSHGFIAKGGQIAANSHIYGPFEAGFGERQKMIIEGWGISDASCAYDEDGGTDITIAEEHVSHACKVTLPRVEGDKWIGLVGPCGGHTKDYHFHRSFQCLYKEEGTHSTEVGNVGPSKLYGKWEDYTNKKLPLLDACGAHFGPVPGSTTSVYHYHVQDKAPFTVGCIGPTADQKLVGVAACRALYTRSGRGCTGSAATITTAAGDVSYMRWCPCFDADGKNTGTIKELPALSSADISITDPTGGSVEPTPTGQPCQTGYVRVTSSDTGLSICQKESGGSNGVVAGVGPTCSLSVICMLLLAGAFRMS